MKVVVDTNVLVSGLLNPYGSPGRVVDLVVTGALQPLHDDRILHEYRDVLSRPRFGFERADVKALLDHFHWAGLHLTVPPLSVVLPDPDDLPFLEVAAAGDARALITGNAADYEPSEGSHQVTVVSPGSFMDAVRGI